MSCDHLETIKNMEILTEYLRTENRAVNRQNDELRKLVQLAAVECALKTVHPHVPPVLAQQIAHDVWNASEAKAIMDKLNG